jgi:hypothetical protein
VDVRRLQLKRLFGLQQEMMMSVSPFGPLGCGRTQQESLPRSAAAVVAAVAVGVRLSQLRRLLGLEHENLPRSAKIEAVVRAPT